MNNYKIALVGAFDRFNYGDILFTYIIEKFFSKNCFVYDYYAVSQNDLSNIGGVKTKSLSELYDVYEVYNAIIIVGGDVLASTWYDMYTNLDRKDIYLLKLFNKLSKRFTNNLCKKKLNGKTLFPWILSGDRVKIFYNSVGGFIDNDTNYNDEIFKCIERSTCFSVRDFNTFKKINNNLIHLVPDTVILLSKYYDNSNEFKLVSENYVVFQCNYKIGNKYFSTIIRELEKFFNMTSIKVVLLPIGLANGHDDLKVLKKIHNQLNFTLLPDITNVDQITNFLANSSAYIGSSLHGSIVSFSFDVPSTGLSSEIVKQKFFYKTWNIPTVSKIHPEFICENYLNLLDMDKRNLIVRKMELQDQIEKYLSNELKEIINE